MRYSDTMRQNAFVVFNGLYQLVIALKLRSIIFLCAMNIYKKILEKTSSYCD